MDEATIEKLARALGFGMAFDLFPGDVIEAARRAEAQRAELDASRDPAREPWPPMQCPGDSGSTDSALP